MGFVLPRNTVGLMSGLPHGVRTHDLAVHEDERGSFAEIFRAEWSTITVPLQWNYVRSRAGVLRGVHVHVRHFDYLLLAEGEAAIGLYDLRDESPTAGLAAVVRMSGARPQAIEFPPGVAHGFLFIEPSVHIYAVSHYWDLADELGCAWDDPGLGIEWPIVPEHLSERDADAPSLAALRGQLAPHQAWFTAALAGS